MEEKKKDVMLTIQCIITICLVLALVFVFVSYSKKTKERERAKVSIGNVIYNGDVSGY